EQRHQSLLGRPPPQPPSPPADRDDQPGGPLLLGGAEPLVARRDGPLRARQPHHTGARAAGAERGDVSAEGDVRAQPASPGDGRPATGPARPPGPYPVPGPRRCRAAATTPG